METFYTPPDKVSAATLVIDGTEYSHLTHVMRKERGDRILVTDGEGNTYEVVVVETTARAAVCEITNRHRMLHETSRPVHLGVALLKNPSKFDFLVEKCTELGVSSITPLVTERTIPRSAHIERWSRLALAAMKQSGRSINPGIAAPAPLDLFLSSADQGDCRVLLHEKPGPVPLARLLPPAGSDRGVTLCVGPEGGFSDEEVGHAESAGFAIAGLGPRRLRTETAAIAAVAVSLTMGTP